MRLARIELIPAVVALLAGGVQAASLGSMSHWLLQLLSLGLLLGVIQYPWHTVGARPANAFVLGWLFGLASFGIGLSWLHISMHEIGGMPFALSVLAVLLFAAYLALYPALALAGAAWVLRARPTSVARSDLSPGMLCASLAISAAWLVAEVARGWVFTGFPWLSVGYGQVDGPLAGVAALSGVHGVSALTVLIAALASRALLPRQARRTRAGGLAALVALPLAAQGIGPGLWVEPDGAPISVRLLQGNVPQDLKFDPQRTLQAMHDYLRAFEASSAQLTVMPETAWTVPWSRTPTELVDRIRNKVDAGHALAVGLPRWRDTLGGGPQQPTNSVMLLSADSDLTKAPVYDKHHLVPFGEFVPLGFRWFVRLMHIPLGDFARGAVVQKPFDIAGQRIAMNICYEDLFGEEIRLAVLQAQASVLANVSNLGWFGRSDALPQHLAISRMRSIETGRPMIRATNTGMTAAIDAKGQTIALLTAHTSNALDASVQGTRGLTPYVRWGHGPSVFAALVGLTWIGWRHRRPHRAAARQAGEGPGREPRT